MTKINLRCNLSLYILYYVYIIYIRVYTCVYSSEGWISYSATSLETFDGVFGISLTLSWLSHHFLSSLVRRKRRSFLSPYIQHIPPVIYPYADFLSILFMTRQNCLCMQPRKEENKKRKNGFQTIYPTEWILDRGMICTLHTHPTDSENYLWHCKENLDFSIKKN